MNLTDLLSKLEGVKGGGNQYTALCPAHDDRKASLCIASGDDGRILLTCQAGCPVEEVVGAMGLTMSDLFPDKPKGGKQLVAAYRYEDSDGKLIAEKLRYEGKKFSWRYPTGSGWEYKKPAGLVLYNLPEVIKADTVWLVEGEKDANAFIAAGITATCSPDGAGKGKWRPHFTDWLRNKTVYIIQDNDDIGKAYAQEEAAAISKVARSVKVLDLCEIWPELPEHGDTYDLMQHLGLSVALLELKLLIERLPEWTPAADSTKPALIRACDVAYEPPK